jgi:Bestrophin, RFP-TM, chloride channel
VGIIFFPFLYFLDFFGESSFKYNSIFQKLSSSVKEQPVQFFYLLLIFDKTAAMISYNPKDWFTFIFKFHKADTFRKLLPLIIGICIYSGIVAWVEIYFWKLSESSQVKNIPLMHGLLGFAISMLLVFITNTAYDRWWEGRKLWAAW